MFTLTKNQAKNILKKFGLPLGGEGPAFREYWNLINHFIEAGVITWDDLPEGTWENGSKKAKYPFTVKKGQTAPPLCPEQEEEESDILEIEQTNRQDKKSGILESVLRIRRRNMAEENPQGNMATGEAWDVNKKLLVSDEYHDAREARTMDRDARRRAAQNEQLAFNAALNNQQFLFNQALRHEGVIFKNDNFPFDMQGDQEMNEPEDE